MLHMLWRVPVSALESLWYALECTCVSFGESLVCFGEYLCQLWRVFGMLWSVPVSALESLWYALEYTWESLWYTLECTLESLWYALECTCVSFGESLLGFGVYLCQLWRVFKDALESSRCL